MKRFYLFLMIVIISLSSFSQGNMRNSYNTGTVTATSNKGMVVGELDLGTSVSISFVVDNASVFALNTIISDNAYGTAKSESELKVAVSLLDGDAVWTADTGNINNGYPILQWQSTFTTNTEHVKYTVDRPAYYDRLNKQIVIQFEEKSDVKLVALNGYVCWQGYVENATTINVAGYTKGVYILALQKGGVIKRTKIIIY